ncbi:MAG: tetratricopeptide repeat protein [Bacteroidales bacterium]|nr:tetratricopeptide repeat protein [Tenuifilaceae bacterium]
MKYKLSILLTFLTFTCLLTFAQDISSITDANKQLDAREYKEAIKLFGDILKQNSRDEEALSGIIRAHLLSENLKDAQKYIDKAIQEYPKNPEFWLRKGILNNMKGQYLKAVDDFNIAFQLSGNQPDIQLYINRGVACMQDENYGSAIADFTDALKINPRQASALNYRAFANYRLANYAESIEDYDKVIELNPESTSGYYNRGMAHLRSGNKIKACSDFHEACSKGNINACKMIVTQCSAGGKQ